MTTLTHKHERLEIGEVLQDGRFRILADQSANQESYPAYQVKQHTYIAQDDSTSPPNCISLRILQRASSISAVSQHELELLESLKAVTDLHLHILAPQETFWYKTNDGEHLCLVYEDLFGPDLWYMSEVVGPEYGLFPAPMIWKMAQQALQSLAFLQRHDIVHGELDLTSFVLTYPKFDASDVDGVLGFYGQPNNFGGVQSLNETCTDREEKPFNLDSFRLKLQGLGKAMRKGEPASATSRMQIGYCPPPEVKNNGPISTATDVWYLAAIIADLAAGTYEFAPRLIGGRSLPPIERLLTIPDAPFTKIRKAPLTDGVQTFPDRDLELLVDLLRRMLTFDLKERWTAKQALEHEFFAVRRPVVLWEE